MVLFFSGPLEQETHRKLGMVVSGILDRFDVLFRKLNPQCLWQCFDMFNRLDPNDWVDIGRLV